MFRGETIESLKKDSVKSDFIYTDFIKNTISRLQLATSYHLGYLDDIKQMFNSFVPSHNHGKHIFMEDLSRNIRLPYRMTWFDFIISKHGKIGILAQEMSEDCMEISIMNGNKKYWALQPVINLISLGKNLIETEVGQNYYHQLKDKPKTNAEHFHTFNTYHFHMFGEGSEIGRRYQSMLDENSQTLIQTPLFVLNGALCLMRCKNIISENNIPHKIIKSGKRKNKIKKIPIKGALEYKTLKLLLPKSQWEHPSKPETEDILNVSRKKMHSVAGHIRTYTEENPGLNGILVGDYWIPDHVRGNKNIGKIEKDYHVDYDEGGIGPKMNK